eukprot:scaffold8307_cov119-Isochrysis_galbana.AAC.2
MRRALPIERVLVRPQLGLRLTRVVDGHHELVPQLIVLRLQLPHPMSVCVIIFLHCIELRLDLRAARLSLARGQAAHAAHAEERVCASPPGRRKRVLRSLKHATYQLNAALARLDVAVIAQPREGFSVRRQASSPPATPHCATFRTSRTTLALCRQSSGLCSTISRPPRPRSQETRPVWRSSAGPVSCAGKMPLGSWLSLGAGGATMRSPHPAVGLCSQAPSAWRQSGQSTRRMSHDWARLRLTSFGAAFGPVLHSPKQKTGAGHPTLNLCSWTAARLRMQMAQALSWQNMLLIWAAQPGRA